MGSSSKKTRNSRNKKDGKMKEIKEKLIKDGVYPTIDEIKELYSTASDDELTTLIADAFINTQEGKEWFQAEVKRPEFKSHISRVKMLIAELANYKFPEEK